MVVSLVIISIVAIFVIFGLRNGFIKWMSVTLGIIAGFWIASQKYFVLEKFLNRFFHTQYQAHLIGFFLVFLLFFFIIVLLGYLLSKVMNLVLLSWLDRLLGAIFGLVAGLIFVWLLLVLAITVQPRSQRQLSKSGLAPRILEVGQRISGFPIRQKITKKYLTSAPETLLLKPQVRLYFISLNSNFQHNPNGLSLRKEV
jgi:membrane protein required for colicin V production